MQDSRRKASVHAGCRRIAGPTIKDRLRVLLPQDPDSYYASREIVPGDMLGDIKRAVIVITNYHAFKLRETLDITAAGRALLQGRGAPIQTLETEGQMLQRVMPELMGIKNVLVINDEAHHCYRAKPKEAEADLEDLRGDDKDEAKKNNEAARLWISGIEAVKRKLGVPTVFDLSATPFFRVDLLDLADEQHELARRSCAHPCRQELGELALEDGALVLGVESFRNEKRRP